MSENAMIAKELTEEEEQELRSKLRLEFLDLMQQLKGRKTVARTVEGNNVSCVYEEVDRSVSSVAVSGLTTPIGVIPNSILRLSDLDHLRFLKK